MMLLHNGTMRGGPQCVEVPNRGGQQAGPRLCTWAGPHQGLLRNSSHCGWPSSARELVAALGRFLRHLLSLALTAAWVLFGGPEGMGGHTVWQHVLPGAGQVMRGGPQRRRWAKPPFAAAIAGAQGPVSAQARGGRQADGGGRPGALVPGATLAPLAPGDGMLWSQAPPGANMLGIRPLTPGRADLGPQGRGQRGAAARPSDPLNAGQPEEGRPGVPVRRVLTVRVGLTTRRQGGSRGPRLCGPGRKGGRAGRDGTCHVRVARAPLGRGALAAGQGLGQTHPRLLAPRAGERPGPCRCLLLAAVVP